MSAIDERTKESIYATYRSVKRNHAISWCDEQGNLVENNSDMDSVPAPEYAKLPNGTVVKTTLTNYARHIAAQRHHISLKEVKEVVYEQASAKREQENRKQGKNS